MGMVIVMILAGLMVSGSVAGLLVLWASHRGWRVPVLWHVLVWDVNRFHFLTKSDPRLDLAVREVQDHLASQGLKLPIVQAMVLNTFGAQLPEVMFGFIFGKKDGRILRPTLLFLPAHRLRECTNADLRIAVAHEFGHMIDPWSTTNAFVTRIRRLEGEDFCHGVAASIYGADQTMATLAKFGITGLCQPPSK